ncbi:MAG: MBL fold metallo-hydrolase [candidate division WOR-3 bacterium]
MRIKIIEVGPLRTNCYIITQQGIGIIIDPGGEEDKIIKGVKDFKIKMILLTHNHFDHIDALVPVAKATGALIAIHPLDSINISFRELKDGERLSFENRDILVIHTPGHTPGSCCFYINGFLFSGDTIFAGGWGNTMFPGGNEEVLFDSIRNKIMNLPEETIIYPGHGENTILGKEKPLYF